MTNRQNRDLPQNRSNWNGRKLRNDRHWRHLRNTDKEVTWDSLSAYVRKPGPTVDDQRRAAIGDTIQR